MTKNYWQCEKNEGCLQESPWFDIVRILGVFFAVNCDELAGSGKKTHAQQIALIAADVAVVATMLFWGLVPSAGKGTMLSA